jgi:hypothetical protein
MSYIRLIGIALVIFVVVFALGNFWFSSQCLPLPMPGAADPHVAHWQCGVTLIFPILASLVCGLFLGMTTKRYSLLLGLLVPILGLLVLWFLGFLTIWYGSDIIHALRNALSYCLLPSAVAALIFVLFRKINGIRR